MDWAVQCVPSMACISQSSLGAPQTAISRWLALACTASLSWPARGLDMRPWTCVRNHPQKKCRPRLAASGASSSLEEERRRGRRRRGGVTTPLTSGPLSGSPRCPVGGAAGLGLLLAFCFCLGWRRSGAGRERQEPAASASRASHSNSVWAVPIERWPCRAMDLAPPASRICHVTTPSMKLRGVPKGDVYASTQSRPPVSLRADVVRVSNLKPPPDELHHLGGSGRRFEGHGFFACGVSPINCAVKLVAIHRGCPHVSREASSPTCLVV